MLEEAKGITKAWTKIQTEAKNSEMEDSCGNPMFRGGIMGSVYLVKDSKL